jgi:hypothetical protein
MVLYFLNKTSRRIWPVLGAIVVFTALVGGMDLFLMSHNFVYPRLALAGVGVVLAMTMPVVL